MDKKTPRNDIQAVLTQRSDDGFNQKEIVELLGHLELRDEEEVDPICLEADSCVLFGFIRMEASDVLLSFDTGTNSAFGRAAIAVANDVKLEREDELYDFAGVKTLMYY